MSLKLIAVDWDRDWLDIRHLLINSLNSPYNAFLRQLVSEQVDSLLTNDRWRNVIAELMDKKDQTLYALKAVNTDSGDLAGIAIFNIHSSQQPAQKAVQRSFPTMAGDLPQVFLSTLNVKPGYETNDVGQDLLQWGIERARSLGIDFWAFSDSSNADLYRSNDMEFVSSVVSPSRLWSIRKRASNNRDNFKNAYLDTEGFW